MSKDIKLPAAAYIEKKDVKLLLNVLLTSRSTVFIQKERRLVSQFGWSPRKLLSRFRSTLRRMRTMPADDRLHHL